MQKCLLLSFHDFLTFQQPLAKVINHPYGKVLFLFLPYTLFINLPALLNIYLLSLYVLLANLSSLISYFFLFLHFFVDCTDNANESQQRYD